LLQQVFHLLFFQSQLVQLAQSAQRLHLFGFYLFQSLFLLADASLHLTEVSLHPGKLVECFVVLVEVLAKVDRQVFLYHFEVTVELFSFRG